MKESIENSNQNEEVVITFLNILLADEYVLYTKTRNAHWNIDGTNYFELHVFLENQYQKLDEIIDDIADHIRSLGHYAMGTLKDFLCISRMPEATHDYSNSIQIIETLIRDHERIIHTIEHEAFHISVELKDIETARFVTSLKDMHLKITRNIKDYLAHHENRVTVPVKEIQNLSINRQN